jgi:hypothetical protein
MLLKTLTEKSFFVLIDKSFKRLRNRLTRNIEILNALPEV